MELAKEMAGKTTLTYTVTSVADSTLLLWHSRVLKLLVKKSWDVLAPKMWETLQVASESFIHLHIADVNGIKTRKKGSNLIVTLL